MTKSSPKKVRVSMTVSVISEQTCRNQTRPTTFLNFGSSQNVSSVGSPSPTRKEKVARERKCRSCSPVMKRNYQLPEITVTGVPGEETDPTDWREVAEQLEEFERKAKQRERRKKARRAKVSWGLMFARVLRSDCRKDGRDPSGPPEQQYDAAGLPTRISTCR